MKAITHFKERNTVFYTIYERFELLGNGISDAQTPVLTL